MSTACAPHIGESLLDVFRLLCAQQLQLHMLHQVPRQRLALPPRRAEENRGQYALVAASQDHAAHLRRVRGMIGVVG